MDLIDFIPSYPNFNDIPKEYDPYDGDKTMNSYYRKKEFYRLTQDEQKTKGKPLQHQKNTAMYLSPFTLNDEILLMDALGSGKCVHPDTLVYINDKNIKISDLWNDEKQEFKVDEEGGEWLKVYDYYSPIIGINKENEVVVDFKNKIMVTHVYREYFENFLYNICLMDGKTLCGTGKHKVLTNIGWKSLQEIFTNISVIGIYTDSGKISYIDHMSKEFYKGYIYDLEVNTTHSYIANGIITHNTCSAITIVEEAFKVNPDLKQALIITKNNTIRRNFINELVYGPCIDARYKPENIENLTKEERVRRINKLVREKYLFTTFETFASEYNSYNDEILKKIFSNRVIIIDEAHNIRIQSKKKKAGEIDVYKFIHRFLHQLENRKIVLMTATPMRDRPEEFASIFNLILPMDKQLPLGKEFMEEFFQKDKLRHKNRLYKYIKGRVGYTRGTEGGVIKIHKGKIIDKIGMSKLTIDVSVMSSHQQEKYMKAYNSDVTSNPNILDISEDDETTKTMGLYNKSRQAALFTYENDEDLLEKSGTEYKLRNEIRMKILGKNNTINDIIENIRKYSCVYADTIRHIIDHPEENVFVYNKFVHGAGAILFSELLKLVGFEKTRGNINITSSDIPETREMKFALIIGESTTDVEIDRILNVYNNPSNRYGHYIQVIVGSGVISEGRSLLNVRQIHIQTPHWNNSETEQAIGRGVRSFSHESLLPEERIVKIYRHAAVPKDLSKSINLIMYKISEDKDILIKQLERFSKESAFNCGFNKRRNQLPTDVDGSRDCDYSTCNYECRDINIEDEADIKDTFNLFYAEEYIDMIITIIKDKFRLEFSYDLKQLTEGITDVNNQPFPDMIIVRALKKIMDKNMILINRYGMPSYLKEENNLYFLVDDMKAPSSFPLCFYNKFPNFSYNYSFKDIIKYSQYNFSLMDKVSEMLDYEEGEPKEIITNQLDSMLPELQEIFLEKAITGKNKKGSHLVRDIVIDHYKNNIFKVEDTTVSTLLEDDDKYRCLKNGKWEDCEKGIESKIEETKQQEKVNVEKNPFGYYGIVNKKGEFKINKIEEVKETDKREQKKGIVCMTITPIGNIIEIFLDINKKGFNIKLPPNIKIDMPESSRKKFQQEILKRIDEKNYKTKRKIKIKGKKTKQEIIEKLDITQEQLNRLSDEEFKCLYYWIVKAEKTDLCNNLKYFFEQNNILINE